MILGANGQPIVSEQAAGEEQQRMEALVKKTFLMLQADQVPYHESAALGMNLILHFVKKQPTLEKSQEAAEKVMTSLHNSLTALLMELKQNEEAAALLRQQHGRPM